MARRERDNNVTSVIIHVQRGGNAPVHMPVCVSALVSTKVLVAHHTPRISHLVCVSLREECVEWNPSLPMLLMPLEPTRVWEAVGKQK